MFTIVKYILVFYFFMTSFNVSLNAQVIKPEVTFAGLFESILETKDAAVNLNVKQAATVAFSKVREMFGLQHAKSSFENEAQSHTKCKQLIDLVIKRAEKQKDDEQKKWGPPCGVKNSFAGILNELLICKDAKTVEWVEDRFKDILLDGLSKCKTTQEKYDYLSSAKSKFDFPHGYMDQSVRELFNKTLDKIKFEAQDRELQKCIDKVKNDENIFNSWEKVNNQESFCLEEGNVEDFSLLNNLDKNFDFNNNVIAGGDASFYIELI